MPAKLERLRARAEGPRRTRGELEVSGDGCDSPYYDFAPVGCVSLGTAGLMAHVNLAAAVMLGRSRAALVNCPFALCVAKPDRLRFFEHLRCCRKNSAKVITELNLCRPDGAELPVQLVSSPLPASLGLGTTLYQTALIDLRERKQVEETWRRRQEQLQLALQMAEAGIWDLELIGGTASWSDAFGELLGLETLAPCVTCEAFLARLHPQDRVTAECTFARIAARQQSDLRVEWRVLHPRKGIRWLNLLGRMTSRESRHIGQVHLVGIGIDITERKQAEAQLWSASLLLEACVHARTSELRTVNAELRQQILDRKRLEQQLLEISEHERRRIGQDLHDGLGQHLTGMRLLNSALRERLAEKSLPEAGNAARLEQLFEKVRSEIRRLARGLHPVFPEPIGLMTALKQLADSVSELPGICCRFDCPQPVLVPDTSTSTHLFRIAQEAVTNALRHGGARRLNVTLTADHGALHLQVQNDGRSWSGRRRNHHGLGLQTMRSRAEAIGAVLEICRADAGGTIVHCYLPGAHSPRGATNHENASQTFATDS